MTGPSRSRRRRVVVLVLLVAVLATVLVLWRGDYPAPTSPPSASDPPRKSARPTTSPRPSKPPVPTPRSRGLLGVYNGPPYEAPDEACLAEFGAYPDLASTYYQPTETIDLAYETARIRRGTSPSLTITTKGTQLLAGIADGEPAAMAWLQRHVDDLAVLAAVDRRVPVYATLEHEFVAKVSQGDLVGRSAQPQVYGRALDRFFRAAEQADSRISTTYWFVGYDREAEGAVARQFTVAPDMMLFDPYGSNSFDTLESITREDLDWLRSRPWYQGQPIGLGEFGLPVEYGDVALAFFLEGLPGRLRKLGLDWAIFFNRTRDANYKISPAEYPEAVSAFARSLSRTP